jgi:hypothetical protein
MEARKYFRWVARGLIIAALASLYSAGGYLGWFGEMWANENHDKVALFMLVMGLGWAGVAYLQQRAHRTASVRARIQFAAAAAVVGIVGLLLVIGMCVVGAMLVAATLITLTEPWLPSSSKNWAGFEDYLKPGGTLAGILLCVMLVVGAGEFVFRRSSLRSGQAAREDDPLYAGAWPTVTVSIALSAFQLPFAGIALVLGIGLALVAANINVAMFPEAIASTIVWLEQNRNMSGRSQYVCLCSSRSLPYMLIVARDGRAALGTDPGCCKL